MEHTLGLSRASDAGHSLIQVVCARGGRYKPEERLSQIIEPGKWTSVFIRLPDGLGDRAMRIDPASRTGIIDISSILLRKVGGEPFGVGVRTKVPMRSAWKERRIACLLPKRSVF